MARAIRSRCRRSMYAGACGLLLSGLAACGTPGTSTDGPVVPFTFPVPPAPPPVTALSSLPPPISGGTLLITRDGSTAAAADSDRDSVWLVDLVSQQVRTRVRLGSSAEPGRIIEDAGGKLHVALRRGGQVATIDPQTGNIELMRAVCAAPRGLAYDAATGNLHVACAGGELVTMPASGGDPTRILTFDRDLRDVVVKGDHLLISRFRSAELIEVDATGTLVGRVKPRTSPTVGLVDITGKPVTTSPSTAWRMTQLPTGEVLMMHQRDVDSTIVTSMPGGYGGGPCKGSGIASVGMTIFSDAQSSSSVGMGASLILMPLGVDVAASTDGATLAVIGPSVSTMGPAAMMPAVAIYGRAQMNPMDACMPPMRPVYVPPPNQPVAGAFDAQGNLWVQSRQPAGILQITPQATTSGMQIPFTDAEDRSDDGHALFHTVTPALIACASCHAEAGDDGHVWKFDTGGPRRSQNLRGGLLATAPFHWDGQMTNLSTLMNTVLVGRMGAPPPSDSTIAATGQWLDAQLPPSKAAPSDPDAVARGQALFNDPSVGCAGCHSGPHYTNNLTLDVGTGQPVQVPSLIDVVSRPPFIHTGCAPTLLDRFNPTCGGGDQHGKTSQLSSGQLDDLVAFLSSL